MDDTKAEDWTSTDEEIARRAYALFEARGGSPGGTWDDWLRAEQQLKAERQASLDGPPTADQKALRSPKSRPAPTEPDASRPGAGKRRSSSGSSGAQLKRGSRPT